MTGLLFLLLALTAENVLDRDELFTVRGDGQACTGLDDTDRNIFRTWQLDAERTDEARGIYGLYNPEAPDQLVLFFADAPTCSRILGVLEEQALIEITKPASDTEGDIAAVGAKVVGNPSERSLEDAIDVAREITPPAETSIWCTCTLIDNQSDANSCDFDEGRGAEVRYAPVVPIRVFGPCFPEWLEGHPDCIRRGEPYSGRRCVEAQSSLFRRMISDLYNLAPQVTRASFLNRRFTAPLPSQCEPNLRRGTLRPSKVNRGEFARIYLYMHRTYPKQVPLEAGVLNLFQRWNREAPPSERECERAKKIEAVQGNSNPVLIEACAATVTK